MCKCENIYYKSRKYVLCCGNVQIYIFLIYNIFLLFVMWIQAIIISSFINQSMSSIRTMETIWTDLTRALLGSPVPRTHRTIAPIYITTSI